MGGPTRLPRSSTERCPEGPRLACAPSLPPSVDAAAAAAYTPQMSPDLSSFPPALPHGPLTEVADGVYYVRGRFRMGPGMMVSRTMAVVRAGDDVTVVNAVRLSPEGEAELERLGHVAHVVKLSDAHGVDDPYYVARFGAAFWSVADARGKVPRDHVLEGEGPIPGGRVFRLANTRNHEAAYLIPQGGGTLLTCDALQNHCDAEGLSWLARLMTPLLGFKGGLIIPKMWRRIQKLDGPGTRATVGPLAAEHFANLVPGHGPAVKGGADEAVRRALDAAAPAAG